MSAFVDEQTAREESEHAFLHHYYGHKIGEVVADMGDDSYCRYWTPHAATRDFRVQSIITACAGRKYKSDSEWLRSKDYRLAYDNALTLSGNDVVATDLLLRWAERIAQLILEVHAAEVEKLAGALVEHGKLTGQQVTAILNGSNGSTP